MKWLHLEKIVISMKAVALYSTVITLVACSSDDSSSPLQKNFPQLLQATAGDGSVALTWVTVKGADGYTVYWMSEQNQTSLSKYTGQAIAATDNSYVHTGLNNGANYRYVVTATVSNIESRESNLVQARPQRTPPAKPNSVLIKPEDDRITLRWDGVSRAERYDLIWDTNNAFTSQSRIQNINSPYVHTGLNNGQVVYYQLLAVNNGGETASEPLSTTPNPNLPSTPTDLLITAQDGAINLAWSDVSNADNYELFWSMNPGVSLQDNRIAGITSAYTHAPLINGQTYYYRLRARNAAGSSVLSGEMQATTNASGSEILPVAGTPPQVPVSLQLAASDGQLDITWQLQQNASGYNLYWATESSPGIPPTINTLSNKIANISPPYTHLGLSNGERYYYRVSAINDGGESPLTPMVNQIPEIVQPGVPGNVTAIGGEGFIGVRWNRVRDAQSYSLYYWPEGGATIVAPNLTEPLHQVSGLNNGTVYHLQVTSTHVQSGESPRSNELLVTPQVDPLAAPLGVRAIPGDSEVELQFDVSGYTGLAADKAVQAYRIYIDTSPGVQIGNNFVNLNVASIAGDTASYTHANLVNGRRYYYTITAVNAGGESPLSREVWAQPQLSVPGAPQNFQLTEADSELTLLWQAPLGTPPINYNLYWSQTLSNGQRSQPVVVPNVNSEISPGQFQYTLSALINNTEYFVQIKAFNESGEGLGSTELGAVPHVIAPTGVPSSLIAQTESLQVTLSWDWDDATQGTAPPHYRLYWSTQAEMDLQNSSWIDAVQSGYIHQGLSNGQAYYYRVAALNDAGAGPVSSLIQAVPLPKAPGQVTGLQTQGSDQAVILSWDDVPGADNYFVYSTTNPILPLDSWNRLSGMRSGDLHQPVSNGVTYYYVITATNLGGESDSSQVENATPQAPAPTAPQGLTATADNTRVILDWSTEIGLTYNIYWVNNAVDDPFTQGQVINDERPAYSHTGLTNSSVYRYVVTANNAAGESAPSQVVSAIPQALQTGAPRNLTAVAADGLVTLSWQPAPAATVNTLYSLYVSNSSGTDTSGTPITNVTSPFMHSGLNNGTQYYYVVTATEDVESAPSNEANARPSPPAPMVPTGLVAIGSDSLVNLSWNASQNASSYTLVWDTIDNFSSANPISLGAVTSYQHTGRSNGTTYYYRLQANNGPASSADSNSVSVTPLAPVQNTAPQLQIVSPFGDVLVKIGESINFQLNATDVEDDALGQPLSYQWDFGSGSGIPASQLKNPGTRRYLNLGIYTVSVTVTDSKGASNNTSQIITVSANQAPDSTITTPTQDVLINIGESVSFSGQGQDQDNNLPLSYHWRFGNNSGIADSNQSAPGTQTFTIPGIHVVQFTVTDSLGLSDPTPAVIVVRVNTPPSVQIDSPTQDSTIMEGGSITLTATGSDVEDDAAGLPLNYLWTFTGPVGIADINQQNPAPVVLNTAGQYSITLTVSDSQGGQAQQSRNITVTNDQPPVIQSPVPVAGIHAVAMDEDNSPTAYAAFVLTANDPEGQDISWSIAPAPSPQPLLGTASFSNIAVGGVSASLDYLVDIDANGVDSFDVRVTDSQGGFTDFRVEITITGQNDLPIFQTNQLTIDEGQTWILNSNISQPNLVSYDVDNTPAELTYQVITVSEGQFELVSNPGTPITSFNQQQVTDQLVSFAHINGSPAPSYSLTIEDLSGTASATNVAVINFTAVIDTLPNPLGFINQTAVALNTDVISNEITVTGINRTVLLSIVGGLYSLDGAAFTSAESSISAGQRIRVQHTSSAFYSRNTTTTLTIGTGSGSFSSRTLTNQAPVMTQPDPLTLSENSTATTYTPQAIDPEGQPVSFSLSGVDASAFELDAATGELQFIVPADFEAPADDNIDNIYQLTVIATDSVGASSQVAVTINILDVTRQLVVELLFPTPGSNVGRGYNTTTTVLSKFVDLELGATVVTSATANSVPLVETSVGSGIWMAQVNALAGENLLDISANIQGEVTPVSQQTIFNNNGAMRDPKGIAVDSATNTAYVIDGGHEALLKVDLTTGLREIISDTQIGTGSDTNVFWPQKILLHTNNTRLFVADAWGSGIVWDIDLASGDRVPLATSIGGAQGLAFYPPNNQVFVARSTSYLIAGIDLSTGLASTISSNTIGVGVDFGLVYDVESNPSNTQYIVANQRTLDSLIGMDPTTGDRISLASDIVGTGEMISGPRAVTWNPASNSVWVSDANGVVDVNLDTLNRTRLLSTKYPVYEATLDATNNRLLLADSENSAIRAMSLADNSESTFSDGATGAGPGFGYNRSAVYDPIDNVVYTCHFNALYRINLSNGNRTLVSSDRNLGEAYDLAIDSPNQTMYGIYGGSSVSIIFKVDLKTGILTNLANSTTGTGPTFTYTNFAVDFASQTAWVTNNALLAVIEVDLSTGNRVVLSDATNGIGEPFTGVNWVIRDTIANRLLVSEGNRIMAVEYVSGNRSIVSDVTNSGPVLNFAREMSFDSVANKVFYLDNLPAEFAVVSIDIASGNRTLVSQVGVLGSGPMFNRPEALSVDPNGNRLFMMESGDGTTALTSVAIPTGDRVIVSQKNGRVI